MAESSSTEGNHRLVEEQEGLRREIEQSITVTSPYPPPHFLREYESICPGTAERLIKAVEEKMAFDQRLSLARFEHEKAMNESMQIQAFRNHDRADQARIDRKEQGKDLLSLYSKGQWFGFVFGLFVLVLAGVAILLHEQWAAVVAFGTIIGLLVVYVLRQNPSENQQMNKQPQDSHEPQS